MDIVEYINLLRQFWYKKVTLLLILILPFILLLVFCQFRFIELVTSQILVIALSTFSLYVLWFFTTRRPKFSKNVIGILFIIRTETEEQFKLVRSRLIEEIEKKLNYNYKVKLLNRSKSESCKFSKETISLFFRKTNARLILFGKCYIGSIDGKENIVIDLDGGVSHRPIPGELQKCLSAEMQELIKNDIYIPRSDDIVNFKVCTDRIELVAKYILGLTFYLSANFNSAKAIYEEIYKEISNIKLNIPIINQIKAKIPQRLFEVYSVFAQLSYNKYRTRKEEKLLQEMRYYLDRMNEITTDDYEYLLLSAIYYFLHGRQINKAKNEIKKCKRFRDTSWLYSDAFLDMYKGNLRDAHRKYMMAFKKDFHHILLFDVEDFISDVLEEEPDKYQLYFALGLINYHYKGDNELAFQNFDTFINNICPKYVTEISIASDYIGKITETNLPELYSQVAATLEE